MGEEKRHEMMETLFGAESEDSEEEDPEALERPAYSDDEAEGGGQVGVESEGERAGSDLEKEESEAERIESEAEREDSDAGHSYDEGHGFERNRDGRRSVRQPAEESDGEQSFGEGDEVEENRYGTADSRRIRQQIEESDGDHGFSEDEADQDRFEKRTTKQQISASGSEKSHGHDADEEEENEVFHRASNAEDEEDEVEQVREASEEGYGGKASGGVAELRDVFGDSDEEDQEPAAQPHSPQEQAEMSASEDEASVQRGLRPDDIVPDEEQREDRYDSDEEQPAERRAREKPVGPPLHLDVPFAAPLGHPDKMHVVRVSNIMGIEPKPFDPKTYIEEEEQFITDESGHKQRIRLEDNVARWRLARNRDGSLSYESNARFVKWSDGSMQLLIGNEVLDISVQKAHQDQAHLFVRHGKGILQSQGRLLQKMKFMPSSLSSKSHRLLTALVDSRNRKVFKVKNVITNKDPEREKEEAEKLQEQRIRSKEDLQRKQEKINRKYQSVRERVEPQLSPGFLEGALEEEEEADDYPQSHNARRFQEQLEAEGRAERRIINAKRQSAPSREPVLVRRPKDRRPVQPKRRQEELYSEESEREPSEYGSDDQEDLMQMNQMEQEEEPQDEEEEEEQEQEDEEEEEDYNQHGKVRSWDDEEDEPVKKRKERDDSDVDESPARKPVQRRRVVVSDSEEED